MATEKEKANNILGYRSIIGIACLVGLAGGFLFGVWDSITVIVDQRPASITLFNMILLPLYSVAIYAVIGCLGMAVMGAISSIVIGVGRYNVNRLQLARIFIAIFVLLSVAVILTDIIMFGNIIDIAESTAIGIFTGVGIAAFTIYALTYVLSKGIRKEKLIALLISLLVSLLVFLYGGLLVNIKLLTEHNLFHPISLLTDFGLLIVVCLLAVGLYVLSLSILRRYNPLGIRRTGYIFLSIVLCAFVIISFIGPFSSKASQNSTLVNPGDLKGKPNIIWIVMDTVRADHLSCYNYYRNTTPNIDRIASEGTLFENTISAAPWTAPSIASMFTGMFPSKHGTDTERRWLDDDFQTIAEVLHLNGYKTFSYVNNHCVSPTYNMDQGFDTIESTHFGKKYKQYESFKLADFLKVREYIIKVQNFLLTDSGAYRTNKVVKRWIADSHQSGTPFFLFIHYMEAHDPYTPPRNYAMPYLGEDTNFSEAMMINQNLLNYTSKKLQLTDENLQSLRDLYDGEISYLDFRMGQLFDYLRELDIMDNTVLIITSDHGENFGDHNLMSHMLCVYDTLLHVPLIIRYPESFEAGLRVDEQVQLTDIFPTILDIVGIDWDGEEEIQGYSLLKDREQRPFKFTIAEHSYWFDILYKIRRDLNNKFDVSIYTRRLKAIRTEEFKYIWASDGRDELYNIRLDPGELDNLIEDEPEKANELKALLIEWLNSFEPYLSNPIYPVR